MTLGVLTGPPVRHSQGSGCTASSGLAQRADGCHRHHLTQLTRIMVTVVILSETV